MKLQIDLIEVIFYAHWHNSCAPIFARPVEGDRLSLLNWGCSLFPPLSPLPPSLLLLTISSFSPSPHLLLHHLVAYTNAFIFPSLKTPHISLSIALKLTLTWEAKIFSMSFVPSGSYPPHWAICKPWLPLLWGNDYNWTLIKIVVIKIIFFTNLSQLLGQSFEGHLCQQWHHWSYHGHHSSCFEHIFHIGHLKSLVSCITLSKREKRWYKNIWGGGYTQHVWN